MTRVKVGFWHGENSIKNLIALADGSFVVEAETPGTTGYNNGPGQDHVYQVSAAGHVLAERHDWEGDMVGSPVDLSYFFSTGPGAPQLWRDPAGATHTVSGGPASASIYFRDTAGRFWWYVDHSGLWVGSGTVRGGRQVDLGRDHVITAAAGCDGAVWALTTNGHVWRVSHGGQTARVVLSLPTGTGVAGSAPYGEGVITAVSDGSVWIDAGRVDQSSSPPLIHLGAGGLIGEASAATSAMAMAWAEGPDGALWLSTAKDGLVRLSARGEARAYAAPLTQNLALDASGRLWFVCQPDLCIMTPH